MMKQEEKRIQEEKKTQKQKEIERATELGRQFQREEKRTQEAKKMKDEMLEVGSNGSTRAPEKIGSKVEVFNIGGNIWYKDERGNRWFKESGIKKYVALKDENGNDRPRTYKELVVNEYNEWKKNDDEIEIKLDEDMKFSVIELKTIINWQFS